MTTHTTIKTTSGKGQVSHGKKSIFSILGIALLVTCLFAGIAQASDNGNVVGAIELLSNGNLFPAGSGLAVGLSSSPDPYNCHDHMVDCFKYGRIVGTIDDAPCFSTVYTPDPGCYPLADQDLKTCRAHFGNDIDRTTSVSSCGWS